MKRKLRLFVMFSGGASGMRFIKDHDPDFEKTYTVVGGFTDNKDASGTNLFKKTIAYDYGDWCARKKCKKSNMAMRDKYFEEVISMLPKDIDLILLSGFMLKITEKFLKVYPNRIINVHPAKLDIVGDDKKPKYRGKDVVKMAMDSGDKETFSTVHFVTGDVDCGPVIAVSEGLAVKEGVSPEEQ